MNIYKCVLFCPQARKNKEPDRERTHSPAALRALNRLYELNEISVNEPQFGPSFYPLQAITIHRTAGIFLALFLWISSTITLCGDTGTTRWTTTRIICTHI